MICNILFSQDPTYSCRVTGTMSLLYRALLRDQVAVRYADHETLRFRPPMGLQIRARHLRSANNSYIL